MARPSGCYIETRLDVRTFRAPGLKKTVERVSTQQTRVSAPRVPLRGRRRNACATVKVVESSLTVTRAYPTDVKQRQVIVKLDGEPFAVLLFGQSVTRAIEPGPHQLRFDNTWVKKTVEFRIAEGEHVAYNVLNRAGRFTWWMVLALGAGPMYLTVERQQA